MGCVCVFALFRLHFILFGSIFFFSVFDFFLLLMFICHQCLCRFFSPFYFQNIGVVARVLKSMQWREKCEKKVYRNKCDTLQFIGCIAIYASVVLPFVETSCSHIDEHVYVLSASFRWGSYGCCVCVLSCEKREASLHCVIFLGVCKVDCYSMRKTVSLRFCKWLTRTHSRPFILSHSEIIGTVPLFCSIIHSCLLPFSEWQQSHTRTFAI